MADEKKFLDQAGVQYLWSRLSMEDYPNNETLIAVLNAIDQTKADKEEVDKQIAVMNDRVVATDDGELTNVLPDMFGGHTPDEYMLKAEMPEVEKSDWSVNDENDAAYIKNRTHWTDDDGTVHKIDEKYLPDVGVRSWNDLTDKPFGGTTTTRILNNYSLANSVSDMSTLGADRNMYNVNVGNIGFNVGDTVTVIWNDEKYVLKAYDSGGVAAVGNDAYVSGGEDTGEPFAIGYMSPSLIIVTFDSDVVVSIDIGETKKMSGKYVEGMGYTETAVKELLPEQEVTIGDDGYTQMDVQLTLIKGKSYTVMFNGTEYECIAWSHGNGICVGNGSIYGDASQGNGEPFSIDSYTGGDIYLNVMNAGTYTVSISGEGEVIHPIEMKYLPDIAAVKTVNGNAPDENGNVVIEVPEEIDTSNFVALTGAQTITGSKTFGGLLHVGQVSGVSSLSGVSTFVIDPSSASGAFINMQYESNGGPWPVTLVANYENKGILKLSNGRTNSSKTVISCDDIALYSSDTGHIKIAGTSSATSNNIAVTGMRTNGSIADSVTLTGVDVLIPSSTKGSTKMFKITVYDDGTLSATEVT